MEGCVRGGQITVDYKNLYDLRYFYTQPVGSKTIRRFTCGLAYESMVMLLHERRFEGFGSSEWYTAVESLDNPVIRGFLAERICLNHIATTGLLIVDKRLGRMQHVFFSEWPNFESLLGRTKETHCLYIPSTFNFSAVDGVILHLDSKLKCAHLYPIQFTISTRHKDSNSIFYASMWETWVKPIKNAGFTLKSTFVWIDKETPSDGSRSPKILSLLSGDRVVWPAYTYVHIGVGQVDEFLACTLEYNVSMAGPSTTL